MKPIIAALFLCLWWTSSQATTINNLGNGGALGGSEQLPMFQNANPALTTTPIGIANFLTGRANAWSTGGNTVPVCALSGTAVTPNAANCVGFTLTLTGSTSIGFPTGLSALTTATQEIFFDITQPAAGTAQGVSFNAAAGYTFPAAGAQPNLTTTLGASDLIVCQVLGGGSPTALCTNNGTSNFQAVSNVAMVAKNSPVSNQSGTTITGSLPNSTAGYFDIVIPYACFTGAGCTNGTSISSVTSSRGGPAGIPISGVSIDGTAGTGVQAAAYLFPNITGGAVTYTATWALSVNTAAVFVAEFKPPAWMTQADAGVGARVQSGSAATSGSIATQGPTTLNGEPNIVYCNGLSAALSSPAVTIGHDDTGNNVIGFLTSPVINSQSVSFTLSPSSQYSCFVFSVK